MREDFPHYQVLDPEGKLDDHSIERNQTFSKPKAFHHIWWCVLCLVSAGYFIYGVIFYEQKLLFGACAALFIYGAIDQIRCLWERWRK